MDEIRRIESCGPVAGASRVDEGMVGIEPYCRLLGKGRTEQWYDNCLCDDLVHEGGGMREADNGSSLDR